MNWSDEAQGTALDERVIARAVPGELVSVSVAPELFTRERSGEVLDAIVVAVNAALTDANAAALRHLADFGHENTAETIAELEARARALLEER